MALIPKRLEQRAIKLIGLFDGLIAKISGLHSYANGAYFNTYMKEVETDIKCMKNTMLSCKPERDQETLFRHLVTKYSDNYCPSMLGRYFSFNNQAKYLFLRTEIDEILKEEKEFFASKNLPRDA